eukprot:TRINITY_DN393_c0_g1_i2.p3 TRINITY_DN393_c0_g1~~TRINITY_DN393_c0_g1_i2.p3  ORF type:complete len:113 (-),score=9.03 TRINITY_DN393_c0_g1_i2:479-817(-)
MKRRSKSKRSGDGNDEGVEGKEHEHPPTPLWKLPVSIVIDIIGVLSVLLGITEVLDLAWAPISAGVIYYLYGSSHFAVIGMVEELLPGTDFFPTATIAFLYFRGKQWYLQET